MTTRKKYSKEYKLDAVSLILDQGYTRREAARSLDIRADAGPVGEGGSGSRLVSSCLGVNAPDDHSLLNTLPDPFNFTETRPIRLKQNSVKAPGSGTGVIRALTKMAVKYA